MAAELDFEVLVDRYYAALYRFALSLTRKESDARDLTQQTFWLWARKGHQLQDPGKVKSWLFTTLHREFLQAQRRSTRFPHHELEEVPDEIPNLPSTLVNELDGHIILECLDRVDPIFKAPVALFYLEDHSYQEIADVLGIPLGTVKSRIARGIAQLQNVVLQRQKRNR
ncbi:MAG TPA: RNA polymerase sigma factor [Verrucomicrobiae bacterium]|nr:RNA polymerase sigma factor [Verrucomicrobiae bacterium]